MKHHGKARKAAFRIIIVTLVLLLFTVGTGAIAALFAGAMVVIAPFLVALWVVFALFTLYFFRDPHARVPAGRNLVVSPAHGKVDVVDRVVEPLFMEGECQRISIFLSVVNVHVQNAPISGRVAFYKYSAGEFLNALRTDSAKHNENALIGFEAMEPAGTKIGVRLIAGVLARRIVPFVEKGDAVAQGDRISLIQFGSRADVYFPAHAQIKVKVGDRVVGGETIIAEFSSTST